MTFNEYKELRKLPAPDRYRETHTIYIQIDSLEDLHRLIAYWNLSGILSGMNGWSKEIQKEWFPLGIAIDDLGLWLWDKLAFVKAHDYKLLKLDEVINPIEEVSKQIRKEILGQSMDTSMFSEQEIRVQPLTTTQAKFFKLKKQNNKR